MPLLNHLLQFKQKLPLFCFIFLFCYASASAFEDLKSTETAVMTWVDNGYSDEEEGELIEKLMQFNHPKSAYLFDFVDYFICSKKKDVNCEENLVNSLEKAPKDASKTVISKINKMLSAIYTENHNYKAAEKYSKNCIELSTENPSYFINCSSNEALRLTFSKEFAAAKKLLSSLIPIAEENQLLNDLGLIYLNLGGTYQKQQILDSALYFYDKAYDVLKNNPSEYLASVYNNIGLIANRLKQYDKAKSNYLKAISTYQKLNTEEVYVSAFVNLIGIFTEKKEIDSAVYYGLKALEILKKTNDYDLEIKILNNVGNAAYYAQDYNKAIAFQSKALDLACHMKDSTEIALIKHNIAYSYIYYNNLDSAKMFFDEAFAIAKRNKHLENQRLALVGLADYYIAMEDFENALNNYALSIEIKDEIENEKTRTLFTELETKFKTLENEKTIQEQELAIYKQQEKEQKLKVQIAALVIGIFLIIILFWFFSYRQKQKNKYALQQAIISEQEKNIEKIIEAEENERQKIARELHDGIVQDLTLLKMQLNQIDENESNFNEKLLQVKTDIDNCTNELRSISHEMMPLSLRDLGLEPALNDLLSKSFESVNIKYQFDAMPMANRLPSKLEITIYRMVQELINNTLKHSKASEVFLSLTFKNNYIIVVYEDNGIGFDLETISNGIGIANLQSRVKVINGNIRFETAINSGVSAFIRIPYLAPRLK